MIAQIRQNISQSLAASIVALLCIVAVGMLQVPQLNKLKNRAQTASPETFKQEVESEKLRLNLLQKTPTFGFNNILADWAFLNFLKYFGDDPARKVTGYQLTPDYFEIIIDRDPRFLQSYLFLSNSSLYAGTPERSVALMEKGLKSLSPKNPPKSYYLWRYKAIDELLFLGDSQAARKSFEKAAEWASFYSDQESQFVAAISRQTAGFIARNPNSKLAQISAWAMVINNATDQRTRQIAISRIEALGGKVTFTESGIPKIQLPKSD
jgi:hypothetical protein